MEYHAPAHSLGKVIILRLCVRQRRAAAPEREGDDIGIGALAAQPFGK